MKTLKKESHMNEQTPIITIRDLKKSYDQETMVLKGVNLEIYPGQIIGYIGPNGAGKTTTVKILIGMLDGFTGYVRIMGYDIVEDTMQIKRKIGYIPEETALYEALTPMEYLRFVGQIYGMDEALIEKKTGKMLQIFNLTESMNTRMTAFSKGMRQKVLITAGLIHDPEIIFLDEPLSGLDANSTIIMKEILVGLAAQGKTIFYCSHIMDVVERISDRIVLIDNGQVIADRPFEELQAMNKEKSLEKIFTQLTGHTEFSTLAQQFISAVVEK
jgi:ABC-2 type transport system ATP-binding protein